MLFSGISAILSYNSRALGFAATRGKLYYRHPELFKVNCNIVTNFVEETFVVL